jgi:hypothetical protein
MPSQQMTCLTGGKDKASLLLYVNWLTDERKLSHVYHHNQIHELKQDNEEINN